MTAPKEFYSIIDYTAPEIEDQAKIAATFAQIQKEWVASYPGYVSARFLASTDGAIVRAIVEWESEDAFNSFEKESDSKGRIAALEAAFRELSTQGSRQTFTSICEVLP
ncbi:antibiotic biosynthesis monooxygenase family protein [Roseinatronobacter alkalisoli]|uniref:Antibiotic biosynthesis monooxygenase n=1 Tax=Roseinatronobacter alkalisoli TaxID=3028235 RepID=A0ABT5TD28_9RHOB|nr:antibiotic biosynthesis monooxygenase [Roseinatronobacter sp. HJB301]MDD7973034.1 antibiotic biosynthesis monooxygenase [Roseinatronobacter sp. HJB301]